MSGSLSRRGETNSEKAYADFLAGYSIMEIASNLGVSTEVANHLVATERDQMRKFVTQQKRSERIEIESQRLDALQSGYWRVAVDGDIKAAELVLKIIDKRIKLFGLDSNEEVDGSRYVLVTGTTKEEYLEILRNAQRGIIEGEVIDEIEDGV